MFINFCQRIFFRGNKGIDYNSFYIKTINTKLSEFCY